MTYRDNTHCAVFFLFFVLDVLKQILYMIFLIHERAYSLHLHFLEYSRYFQLAVRASEDTNLFHGSKHFALTILSCKPENQYQTSE